MFKKFKIKTEYFILISVIFTVMLFLLPFSSENTRQAVYISRWNEIYNRLDYMCSVLNAHVDDDMIKSMKRAKTTDEKEKLLLTIIKPYLRINTSVSVPKRYKPVYKNKTKISKNDLYYFDEFYFAKNKTIVTGIKNIYTKDIHEPLFIMMFDMNGILPPNRWGVDIFGVNIYDKGKIEPFGFGKTMDELHDNCSKTGTGIDCSYYYIIGGEF